MSKSVYPICHSVEQLESLSSGTVVYMPSAIVERSSESTYFIVGGTGIKQRLLCVKKSLSDLFVPHGNTLLIGCTIHVRVVQVERHDPFSWARAYTEVEHYEPQPGACTCGAVYTFLPTHHSSWCDSHRWS